MTDAAVLRELVNQVCASIDALTQAVIELRDLVAVAPADEPEAITVCAHPDEARVSFSSMLTEEWECTSCGAHYGPVVRGGGHA